MRIAEIGPLFVKSGERYTALYAEGISNVGDVTPVHHHPAPEAWYTTAGEMCVETPAGKMVGRAGETNIIPADTPVTILATGTEQRRSVWLVLHESAHPWTAPINWTPKGLQAVVLLGASITRPSNITMNPPSASLRSAVAGYRGR